MVIKIFKSFEKAKDILISSIMRCYYTIRYDRNGNKFVCKARLIDCKINISGKNHLIELRGGVFRNVKFQISGTGHQLVTGNNVCFHEGGRIMIEDEHCSLFIGEDTDFVSCFFAIRDNNTKVQIGKDCMFSAQTIVRTSDAHSIVNQEGERINHGKDVIIGNHVWVCYGANILKGTMIGNNSIVGTQSVVAGMAIPEGSVAVGNPAKIVKGNINWMRERIN